jgi:cytoskeletal protein CcmA (bactofilin family)
MSLFNRDKPDTNKPAGTLASLKPQAGQPQPAPAQPLTPQAAQPQAQNAVAKPIESKPVETPSPVSTPKPTPIIKQGAPMASVISKALKITGELESTEDIQIDGQIEGDVRGVGVKIGQAAKVKGTVYGDEVELAGTIEGRIEAKKVILAGTARMTGDIAHQDIKIESGAYINGSLKPELNKAEQRPASKPVAVSTVSSVSPLNATGTAHH